MCGRRAAIALSLLCCAFDWPGGLARHRYALRQPQAQARGQAIQMIAKDPSAEATELILRALEDRDPGVRTAAARLLADRAAAEARPALLDLAHAPQAELRAAALAALGHQERLHPSSTEPVPIRDRLLEALDDPEPGVRTAAAGALAEVASALDATDPGLAPILNALVSTVNDPRQAVAVAATAAIGGLGRRAAPAAAPMAARLSSRPPALQQASLRALAALRDPSTLPAIADMAQRLPPGPVAIAACQTLGELGRVTSPAAAQATAALQAILSHTSLDGSPRPPSDELRLAQAAIDALAYLATPPAIAILLQRLAEPRLQHSLVQALRTAAERAALDLTKADSQSNPVVVQALAALGKPTTARPARILGQLLSALGQVVPIDQAHWRLRAAFAKHPLPELARALARVGDATPAPIALARLSTTRGPARQAWLAVLQEQAAHGLLGPNAVDALHKALTGARTDRERRTLIDLLGRTQAPRALTALVGFFDGNPEENAPAQALALRTAAAEALTRIADPQAVPRLLPWLVSPRTPAALRLAIAAACGASADAAAVARLLPQLDERSPSAVAMLWSLALALPRVFTSLAPDLATQLLDTVQRLTEGEDTDVAIAASWVLASHPSAVALEHLGPMLRHPEAARRTHAAMALGRFSPPLARPLLRYMLRRTAPEVRLGVLLGLAEVGDERDLAVLLKSAARDPWPLAGAVAFALQRFVVRGVVPAHTAQRALCTLGERRHPLVQANVAAALAYTGAGPCAAPGPNPQALLAQSRSPAERIAGALWLNAAAARGHLRPAEARQARRRCALDDPDPAVRRLCHSPRAASARSARGASLQTGGGWLQASGGLADRPLAYQLVATQLSDAAVRVQNAGPAGLLWLPTGPARALRLFDPGLLQASPPPCARPSR